MTAIDWNTNQLGRRRVVHCKWINTPELVNGAVVWSPINHTFRADGSGFVSRHSPGVYSLPQFADQPATLAMDTAFDIHSRRAINESAFAVEITPQDVSPVPGHIDETDPSRVIYPDAFARGIDLRYSLSDARDPRYAREVVIRNRPRGVDDINITWRLRTPFVGGRRDKLGRVTDGLGDGAKFRGQGVVMRAGKNKRDASLVRGSGIRSPIAWYYDTAGEYHYTEIDFRIVSRGTDTIEITKTIPRDFINEAFDAGAAELIADDVQTIYPDPNTGATTVDGFCGQSIYLGAWSTIRAGAGNQVTDAGSGSPSRYSAPWTVSSITGTYDHIYRGILTFDLGALEGVAESASLTIKKYDVSTTLSSDGLNNSGLTAATPALWDDLVAGDYAAVSHDLLSDYQDETDWAAATITYTLTADGLTHLTDGFGSIAGLALRSKADILNADPGSIGTGTSRFRWYSAENAGTTDDPALTITYGAAPAESGMSSGVRLRCLGVPKNS